MPLNIEDYAIIGDCETTALVGRDLLSTAETKCAKWRRESVPVGLREKGCEALICWCAADLGFGVGVSFGR